MLRTLYQESLQLSTDSSFQLTKWATNTMEVYADIPEDQHAPTNTLLQDHNSPTTQGAMGLRWNPLTDLLTLDGKAEKTNKTWYVECAASIF